MQDAEGTRGGFLHLEGGLRGVALKMKLFHAGMHHISAENIDEEKSHQDEEGNSAKRPSTVKPFRDQMSDGNSSAPELNDKVAIDQDLGRGSRMWPAKQAQHLIRKEGRRPGESEKDDCSHPHCGVQNSDYAKKPEHGASLRKSLRVPSRSSGEGSMSRNVCGRCGRNSMNPKCP